jgi:nicotinamidase-related amidase
MTAERVWDRYLTKRDKAHLAALPPRTGYGFGTRPAVLSVDNYRGVIGDRPEPLLESIKTWPNSTGLEGWQALDRIAELFAAARGVGVPVIHVSGAPTEVTGVPRWRTHGLNPPPNEPDDRFRRRYDIVEQAKPLPAEAALTKSAPSAFFGTPLAPYLIGQGIDTLIVCGEAVSGCVRATVVDGCSYRLRMIVVEDCVYDRHQATWAMNLFDIHHKYGDVVSLRTTLDWLAAYRPSPSV